MRKNTEDLSHFYCINRPDIAYLLGFLWADGYICKSTNIIRLTLSGKDKEAIYPIVFRSANTWKMIDFVDKNGRNKGLSYVIFTLHHQGLHSFLVENDYQVKSGCSADKILSRIPEYLCHYWWRGYFDGDGCFSLVHPKTSGASLSIGSVYHQDWSFFLALCNKLNIKTRIQLDVNNRGCSSTVNLRDEYSLRKFCDYIYQGEQFGLHRKHQRYLDFVARKDATKSRKSSIYRGVYWSAKYNKWILQIQKKTLRIWKTFESEIEAAQAYDKEMYKCMGSRRMFNFPSAI